jgi:hypothetical protein
MSPTDKPLSGTDDRACQRLPLAFRQHPKALPPTRIITQAPRFTPLIARERQASRACCRTACASSTTKRLASGGLTCGKSGGYAAGQRFESAPRASGLSMFLKNNPGATCEWGNESDRISCRWGGQTIELVVHDQNDALVRALNAVHLPRASHSIGRQL